MEWTTERIVAAIQAWEREHSQPPRRRDWNRGGPGHPAGRAVYRRFGS